MGSKLIFLDVDGTLKTFGQPAPPDSALRAMRGAQQKGHRLVVCTGRSHVMLGGILPYGFDAVVCSAGGYILYNGEVIYDHPMEPELLAKCRRVFDSFNCTYVIEGQSSCYLVGREEDFMPPVKDIGDNSEIGRMEEQTRNELGMRPIAEYTGEPIYKIVYIFHRPEDLAAAKAQLEGDFVFVEQGVVEQSLHGEIINRAFNKGTAVRLLAEHLGVDIADTVAFGDSMNDAEMMLTAGLSICMGNGDDQLKALCNEVCGRVDEDGLYHAFLAHDLC